MSEGSSMSSTESFQLLNPTSPGFDANYVIQQLKKRPEMESFYRKYESTFNALVSSYTNVERLSKKCEQLNQDILLMATKVKTAQKQVTEDQQQMSIIKKEIEKQWGFYDAAKQKDKEAQNRLDELQEKCNQLQKEIQLGVVNDDRRRMIEQLEETEAKLKKEYELEHNMKIGLINSVTKLQTQYDDLIKQREELLMYIQNMRIEISDIEKKTKEEQTERDKAKLELEEAKILLRRKLKEIEEKKIKLEVGQKELQKFEQKAAEQSQKTFKAQKHIEDLKLKMEKLEREFKDIAKQTSKLSADNEKLRSLIHTKETSIAGTKEEQRQIVKVVAQKMKEKKKREEKKLALENYKQEMEGQVRNLKDHIMEMKRILEFEKSKIEDLSHQKGLLDKSILKADKNLEEEEDSLKVVDSKRRNVQLKFKAYVQMIEKKRQDIYRLKKEIDKYDKAFLDAKQKYDQSQEEIKIKKLDSDDLKKKIREGRERHRQQMALYDAVKAERNTYSKRLIDADSEIQEEKQKFKIMTQQIDKIREDIQNKEEEFLHQKSEYSKLCSKREVLTDQLKNLEKSIEEQADVNKQYEKEINKLNEIIKEAEQERKRQEKELEVVVGDRDILGSQLIKRNNELAGLYERIKSQQSLISKGAVQYQQRINDIQALNEKINQVSQEHEKLSVRLNDFELKKNEVHSLRRQLLQEQSRVKALEEELQTPMNVHRWRRIQGSDPNSFEMIEKIQKLQKQLIAKTEEVMEKDLLIREKEKLYAELKSILTRQPGPEVVEQYNVYQQTLKEKTKKHEEMLRELELYMIKTRDLEYENQKYKEEFFSLKSEFFKKKEEEKREYRAYINSLNSDLLDDELM